MAILDPNRSRNNLFEVLCLPLLLMVGLPVILIALPFVVIADAIADYRRKRVAKGANCERCGHVLGLESINLADELRERKMSARCPQTKFRLGRREIWAICANCGAFFNYKPKIRKFLLANTQPVPLTNDDYRNGEVAE